MTTRIEGIPGSGPVGLSCWGGNVFTHLPNANAQRKDAGTSRADFLAAVAKECDVIVVDRADLPEVETLPGGAVRVGNKQFTPTAPAGAADHRKWAIELLALAEYLDAHPPIDEAQVEALAGLLGDPDVRYGCKYEPGDIARRLLATGRIEVKP